MKTRTMLLLLVVLSTGCFAQEQAAPGPRKSNQYVGLQANQLLRQLFNFGGSTPAITNPYLLTYAINSAKSGAGLNLGFGYSYDKFASGDIITPRESTVSNFAFRVGMEKKFNLGKRWFSSYGADVLFEKQRDKTETNFNQGPGAPPFVTTTETTVNTIGVGPRFTLNFGITEQIILGTEASFYYKSGDSTQESTQMPTIRSSPKSFSLIVPAVLFVILKF